MDARESIENYGRNEDRQVSGNTLVDQLHFEPLESDDSSTSTTSTVEIGQGFHLAWVFKVCDGFAYFS